MTKKDIYKNKLLWCYSGSLIQQNFGEDINEHGNEVHLTVSVLHYVNEKGEKVDGVVSNYLANLKVGDKVILTGLSDLNEGDLVKL